MSAYDQIKAGLSANPKTWLVTGVAGFIGSHLLETLLKLDQSVAGLDNFATGKKQNLVEVQHTVSTEQWKRFRFIEGDIQDLRTCLAACRGNDYVLHQAALGSVPRSIEDPLRTHAANITGFVNMLVAARDSGVKRFVYASSSSVYGDDPNLPKQEGRIGKPLSPYALTKLANEHYAAVFARCYEMENIGLRYFNVFGARQDPDGPYAAVIPKWIAAMLRCESVEIYGDGETSRDFCYVENAVQANLLAATTINRDAINQVYNIAVNQRATLNELHALLRHLLSSAVRSQSSDLRPLPSAVRPPSSVSSPLYLPFRPGDVRHSQADISHAQKFLGYEPTHTLAQGLEAALPWYVAESGRPKVKDQGSEVSVQRPAIANG